MRKSFLPVCTLLLSLSAASCVVPPFVLPTAQTNRLRPGGLTLVETGTTKSVPEALILVVMVRPSKAEKRLTKAFVFHEGEPFSIYREKALTLLTLDPMPLRESTVGGFIVVAPGFAPKHFPSELLDESDHLDWPLRPIAPGESARVLGKLKDSLTRGLIDGDTLRLLDDDQEGIPHEANEWDHWLSPEKPIRVMLSPEGLRRANDYIDAALRRKG